MRTPIEGFETRRLNVTLHGRSVHRPQDVPGHNVFKGYSSPGTGDALDIFTPGGTPVWPIAPGLTITRWQGDTTKKEVVYLEGMAEGKHITAVYAHINFNESYRVGAEPDGTLPLGYVRFNLGDPHLHFELWIDGKAINDSLPQMLRHKMLRALPAGQPDADPAAEFVKRWGISDGTRPEDPSSRWETWEMLRRYHEQFGPKEG